MCVETCYLSEVEKQIVYNLVSLSVSTKVQKKSIIMVEKKILLPRKTVIL